MTKLATTELSNNSDLTEDFGRSTGGWDLFGLVDEDALTDTIVEFHLTPRNDLKEHEAEVGGICWCRPIQNEDGLWIHNSVDRREDYENATH